ncbi:unnamed protein product [marine sediment metagenome]|uniref:Uncharacterized protein n=1 Tax=marine sediment metagenome TaxID=412755 RepID=X0X0B1_9ZZZZ
MYFTFKCHCEERSDEAIRRSCCEFYEAESPEPFDYAQDKLRRRAISNLRRDCHSHFSEFTLSEANVPAMTN